MAATSGKHGGEVKKHAQGTGRKAARLKLTAQGSRRKGKAHGARFTAQGQGSRRKAHASRRKAHASRRHSSLSRALQPRIFDALLAFCRQPNFLPAVTNAIARWRVNVSAN